MCQNYDKNSLSCYIKCQFYGLGGQNHGLKGFWGGCEKCVFFLRGVFLTMGLNMLKKCGMVMKTGVFRACDTV